MGIGPMVYLDDPTLVNPLDATKETLGAPGQLHELRYHMCDDYGWQVYRLTLNESGGELEPYYGVELAATTTAAILLWNHPMMTVTSVSGVATDIHHWGGVPQVTVPDDNWFWSLIEGQGQMWMKTPSVRNGVVELAALGFGDTQNPGTGLISVGTQTGTDVGTADEVKTVFFTRGVCCGPLIPA